MRRFLATLYTDGTREVREATIEVSGEEFRARGGVRVTELGGSPYILTTGRQRPSCLTCTVARR